MAAASAQPPLCTADDDDEVIVTGEVPGDTELAEAAAKRRRVENTSSAANRAPTDAYDGLGFKLIRAASLSAADNRGTLSLNDLFTTAEPARWCVRRWLAAGSVAHRPPAALRPSRRQSVAVSYSLVSALRCILSNMQYHIPWLILAEPKLCSSLPVLALACERANDKAGLITSTNSLGSWTLRFPFVDDKYGSHHTKFCILQHGDWLRVCVHTANYVPQDWSNLSQGAWLQDFPLKTAASPASSQFETDLLSYLDRTAGIGTAWPGWHPTGASQPICRDALMRFDFSGARASLVAAVPGRHYGEEKMACVGHMRVRSLLARERFHPKFVAAPLVWQFSSCSGSSEAWLRELVASFSAGQVEGGGGPLGPPRGGDPVLVWPLHSEMLGSWHGEKMGASIPGSQENVNALRRLMHRWSTPNQPENRGRCMPHIKTWLRHAGGDVAWCYVGSANLSRAAWGNLEKNGTQLYIKSFELGVILLPSHLAGGTTSMVASSGCGASGLPPGVHGARLALPLPFALPPVPYAPDDVPWISNHGRW